MTMIMLMMMLMVMIVIVTINKKAYQLMMSQVRAGQVLSLQSSLSCASL